MRPIKLEKAHKMRSEPTKSEHLMWQALRGNRFHGLHFRRQHVVLGYIVDLYCSDLKLVIEIDGTAHDSQVAEDLKRQKDLEQNGLRVFRVASGEVEGDLNGVLDSLKIVCEN